MTPDIKRILVPLDFSANSNRALDYAIALARMFDATLHLIHVCDVPALATASLDAYAVSYTDWSRTLGEEAEKQLVDIARERGLHVTSEVLFGRPAPAIIEAASTNGADLIVMGTHGHGAVMHLMMGNVAERVVRGAPCPVLTVREPRLKEWQTAKAGKLAVAGAALLAALLLAPLSAAAQDTPMKQTTTGGAVFSTYCASCHGTTARGDGPLAASMRRKPANLTEIAKRNGGEFPADLVFRTIDGSQKVRGHGGPDMPEWGEAFAKSREAGDAERVKKVIQSLVDYLAAIQVRPTHERQQ